jgi:hypothetical protein
MRHDVYVRFHQQRKSTRATWEADRVVRLANDVGLDVASRSPGIHWDGRDGPLRGAD